MERVLLMMNVRETREERQSHGKDRFRIEPVSGRVR